MSRNIVLCSDGTGNTAVKGRGSNVFKLYEAVDRISPTPGLYYDQIAFYDDGVGTSRLRPLAILGGAVGLGLGRNVRKLYAALARVYEPGDKIFLFGFSRGAFTVRTLGGLIAACGIVDRRRSRVAHDGLERAVGEAYCAYRSRYRSAVGRIFRGRPSDQPEEVLRVREQLAVQHEPRGGSLALEGWQVPIAFIGVWDTVDAVGLPVPWMADLLNKVWRYKFPDQRIAPTVLRACHALSIDDERQTFHPLLWDMRPGRSEHLSQSAELPHSAGLVQDRVKQVWFAGVHSNVGGGYPKQGMSLVSLVWMMDEARDAGLRFSPLDDRLYRERQNVHDHLYDSRASVGFFYRFMPRDIARLCTKNGIHPVLHSSVLNRLLAAPDGYAPGNLPRHATVDGTSDTSLLDVMSKALDNDPSLLQQVRNTIRFRWTAQFAVLVVTFTTIIMAFRSTESVSVAVLSSGIPSTIGTFVWRSFSETQWPAFVMAIAGLAYVGDWIAANRMRKLYSRFWHGVRGTVEERN